MKWISYKVNNYYKKFVHKAKYIKGTIRGNLVNVYWFNSVPNFGDLLNPEILRYYGLTPIHTSRQKAEALVLGSNLDNQTNDFSGYVIGTGLKTDIFREFPKAKIYAVRGELTRERIGAKKNTPLGDPGLLVSKLLKKRENKKFIIGVVPHFVDKNNKKLKSIISNYKNEILFVDVQEKPKEVISKIDQCEFILSSSLHGLVTADSLGIPNGWVVLSDKVQGKGFKFFDYATAIGRNIKPSMISGDENLTELIKMTQNVCGGVKGVQEELDSVFRLFSNEIRNNRSK